MHEWMNEWMSEWMNESMNSLFSIFIVQNLTALQITHNNRINENGSY